MIPLEQIPIVPDSIPSPKDEWKVLSSLPLDELIDKLVSSMVTFAINLAIAFVVFYVGKFIIKKIHNVVAAILIRRKVDKSLSTFVLSFVRMALYFILIVTVVGILGIETSSFIAIFASAGVAIGMALSGTLQNFAGGILILLLKPYKVGDYIEAQGFSGTVTEIQIFHTIICTYDNKSIIIPNGGLSTGSINNWSREDYRRVDWNVAISYGDDVAKARETILKIFDEDDRIVKRYVEDDREARAATSKDPMDGKDAVTAGDDAVVKRGWLHRFFHHKKSKVKVKLDNWKESVDERVLQLVPKVERKPSVTVDSLGDSSVNLKARAWTRCEFYWSLYYDINEKIYNELPKHGVNFPFPQMDVHVTKIAPEQ